MSTNKIMLEGFLGADPEIRITASNRKCARLSLATSNEYRNGQGEPMKETQWHQLIAWGKLADQAEIFGKGDKIQVTGRLGYRSYEDRSGAKRYVAEITVLEIAENKTRVSVDLGAENEH
ncbi:MAG: single-stranded DNA-binding protein [Flavihumibacter sp.]